MTDKHEILKELQNEARDLLNLAYATRDAVLEYYNLLGTILFENGIVTCDGKLNKEDVGVVDVFEYVTHSLNLYNARAVLHYRYEKTEFDMVIFGSTLQDRKRVVSVEFKDSDFAKAVEQAYLRQDYANYSYVVVNSSPQFIIDTFWNDFKFAKEHGIGVIAVVGAFDRAGIVLTKAKYNPKPKVKLYDHLVDTWNRLASKEQQTKIIEFVSGAVL